MDKKKSRRMGKKKPRRHTTAKDLCRRALKEYKAGRHATAVALLRRAAARKHARA
jgi:ribosomal protein L21E